MLQEDTGIIEARIQKETPRIARRLTGERARLESEVALVLPRDAEREAIAESTRAAFGAAHGKSVEIVVNESGLADIVPNPVPGPVRVRFYFGAQGSPGAGALETTLVAARYLVSRVIGVDTEKLGESDLLTHLESGVLAYFVERFLHGLQDGAPSLSALQPVTLDAIVNENTPFEWGDGGPESWYAWAGGITIESEALPFRLTVRWKRFQDARADYDTAGEAAADRRRATMRSLAETLGHKMVPLSGKVGEVHLTPTDVAALERNDIILFESSGIAWEDGVASGTLRVSPKGCSAANGSLVCSIEEDGAALKLAVQQFIEGGAFLIAAEGSDTELTEPEDRERKEDETQEMEPVTGDGDAGDDDTGENAEEAVAASEPAPPSVEGAELAAEVPVVLRVELGSVRMTLQELSQLGSGSILELKKNPDAPVSLVVEDRRMGRGELVTVEGELGVRILSLG